MKLPKFISDIINRFTKEKKKDDHEIRTEYLLKQQEEKQAIPDEVEAIRLLDEKTISEYPKVEPSMSPYKRKKLFGDSDK